MDFGFLSDAANSEYVNQLLSPEMQAKLTQYVFMVGIVWRFVRKTVDNYLQALSKKMDLVTDSVDMKLNTLTKSIDSVANEMSEFRAAMERVETNHEKRLGVLENRVDYLAKIPKKEE